MNLGGNPLQPDVGRGMKLGNNRMIRGMTLGFLVAVSWQVTSFVYNRAFGKSKHEDHHKASHHEKSHDKHHDKHHEKSHEKPHGSH